MKHTMSMYQTKDAMLEAMQTEIDSLEAQLAEARKDSERLDWVISRLYWIDGIDEIARGTTPREAIDNAMKGGE